MAEEPQRPVLIEPGDVVVREQEARIYSPELTNFLIRNQEEALGLLADTVASVDVEQISVDRQGRVVIESPDFVAALTEKMAAITERPIVKNVACGAGC